MRTLLPGLLSLLVGCAALPEAPMTPTNDAAFDRPVPIEPPGQPDDPPEPMRVLPGDVLRLQTVSVQPLVAEAVAVDSAGWAHLPLVGDVPVGGLTLTDAERRVEEAVHRYDRFARVSLTPTSTAGHRVTVVGAVDKPGVYPAPPDARVADALALAGGPSRTTSDGEALSAADLAAGRVVRGGVALPISLERALRGELHHNVRLHAGDLVFVPAATGRHVSVLGFVSSPRSVPFRSGMRLTEVLAMAGGTTKDADASDVRVLRGPLSRPSVYRADVAALMAGEATDVELAAGDVVFVTEHWFASTTDVVGRLTPILAASALAVALGR